MTAIGIGVSDREPFTMFVNKPQYYSDLEIEYFEAVQTDKDNWKMWDAMIESRMPQDAIDEKFDECSRWEKHVTNLKHQLKCNHSMQPLFAGGGFIENEICQECGVLRTKTIKQHKSGLDMRRIQ
jgi:hypothetical protein